MFQVNNVKSNNLNQVTMCGMFYPNGTSAVATQYGGGATAAYSTTGTWTVTLHVPIAASKIRSKGCHISLASAANVRAQIAGYNESTGVITIKVIDGSASPTGVSANANNIISWFITFVK